MAQNCAFCMQLSSSLSVSKVLVGGHVVSTCAGKLVQVELCCVSMTAFGTICNVVNIHRATMQIVLNGHNTDSVKGS